MSIDLSHLTAFLEKSLNYYEHTGKHPENNMACKCKVLSWQTTEVENWNNYLYTLILGSSLGIFDQDFCFG